MLIVTFLSVLWCLLRWRLWTRLEATLCGCLGYARRTDRAKMFCRSVKVWFVKLFKRSVRGLESVADLPFAERAAWLVSAGKGGI
jgi:hypothetical protein